MDIVCLTETNVQSDVSNAELFPDLYEVHRCDRDLARCGLSKGGGVLLAARRELNMAPVDLTQLLQTLESIEIVGVQVGLRHLSFYIFVLYIPPTSQIYIYDTIFEYLETLPFLIDKKIIVIGDFNITNFNNDRNDSFVRSAISFIESMDLIQRNVVTNVNGRLLDLVLTNIKDCQVILNNFPFTNVDPHHPPLLLNIGCSNYRSNNFVQNRNQKCFNFRRANFPLLYNLILSADWRDVYFHTEPNSACDEFYDCLNHIFEQAVPLKIIRKHVYPAWFNRDIITNIKQKHKLFKKFKIYKTEYYYSQYKILRASIKRQINIAFKTYLRNAENQINADSASFSNFVRNKKVGRSRIPGIMRNDGNTLSCPQDIVDSFGTFFRNVYIESDPNIVNLPIYSNINFEILNCTMITEDEIIVASNRLKDKPTAGIDMIPGFVAKDCIRALIKPIAYIFNLIIASSIFPERWKIARVCPIFKKGDKSLIQNYRAVSILCNFSKLFEIVIYNKIYPHVKPIISCNQYGFMNNRSCIANLACLNQYLCQYLDDRGQVDVIYLDFQKAFDQVDHFVLLKKLESVGFSPNLLNLIKSYLTGRKQFVEYEGFRSSAYAVSSGVPQGSNLGPLFFLVFINDLTESLSCPNLLFADDLKLYHKIEGDSDSTLLQRNLDHIVSWCNLNRLQLNASKCSIVSFSKKVSIAIFDYRVNNLLLLRVENITDLGVVYDNRFTFNKHIEKVISESSRMLGFLYRNCREFENLSTLKLLFYSYIRSKLEYGCIIWYPLHTNQISGIERIQRKFMRYLWLKEVGTFPDRGMDNQLFLNRFNMVSLEKRREMLSINFLFNLIHNKIDCPYLTSRINLLVPRLNSRQHLTFYEDVGRTNVLYRSPLNTMCRCFNKISRDCDIFCDSLSKILKHFK